jgi:hypothetical protein
MPVPSVRESGCAFDAQSPRVCLAVPSVTAADSWGLETASYTVLINMAGRQRMLSQRIGLLLMSFAHNSHASETQERHRLLTAALSQFEDSHALIVTGRTDESQKSLALPGLANFLCTNGHPASTLTVERQLQDFIAGARLFGNRLAADPGAGMRFDRDGFERLIDSIVGPILQITVDMTACLERDIQGLQAADLARESRERGLVMRAAEQIAKAADIARMISFNARISAARAGEFGREFTALTNEIKSISDDIQSASKAILVYMKGEKVS